MTPAMGRGYQVQNFDQEGIKHVLLLAAGTGIAPIRAAIESDVLGLDKVGPADTKHTLILVVSRVVASDGSEGFLFRWGCVALLLFPDPPPFLSPFLPSLMEDGIGSAMTRWQFGAFSSITFRRSLHSPFLPLPLSCPPFLQMSRYSRLYFGVRSPAYLPYTEKFPEWEARGVKIIPCFSRTPVPMNSPGYWGKPLLTCQYEILTWKCWNRFKHLCDIRCPSVPDLAVWDKFYSK